MGETAYEWGQRHGSCHEALEMRREYASQADWWRACPRGDWLLWQLGKLSAAEYDKLRPQISRATEVIVTSAIVEHALDCGVPEVEEWAARWLSGEDRSAEAAVEAEWKAACASAESAALAAEAARAAAAPAPAIPTAGSARVAWAARAAEAESAAWEAAVEAAESTGAEAAELQRQADDIRAEIPRWPGGRKREAK